MIEQNFEKGQLVLIRHNDDNSIWNIHQYFGKYNGRIYILGGNLLEEDNEIIPYKGNERFLGTTDSSKPKWKPKPGEAVLVRNSDVESWKINFFVDMYEEKYVTSSYEALIKRTIWKQCKPLCDHFNVPEKA